MFLATLIAIAVCTLRLILFHLGRAPEGTDFLIVHFSALVTIVFFTDHRLLRTDKSAGFPDLMREGFKSAAVYALIVALFIWIYYASVEANYFQNKVNAMVAKGMAEGQPESVIRPRMERFFTPFNYTTITFFTMLIAGAFNALLLGALHHKVLRRFTR